MSGKFTVSSCAIGPGSAPSEQPARIRPAKTEDARITLIKLSPPAPKNDRWSDRWEDRWVDNSVPHNTGGSIHPITSPGEARAGFGNRIRSLERGSVIVAIFVPRPQQSPPNYNKSPSSRP